VRFRLGGPLRWYSTGHPLTEYLRCLLDAQGLHDKYAIVEIPHGRDRQTYLDISLGVPAEAPRTPPAKQPALEHDRSVPLALADAPGAADDGPEEMPPGGFDTPLAEPGAFAHGSPLLESSQPPVADDSDEDFKPPAVGHIGDLDGLDLDLIPFDEDAAIPPPPLPPPPDVPVPRLFASVWGHFSISTKQPGRDRPFGGYQAECRYHRKNQVTGCKKYISVSGPGALDRELTLNMIRLWCNDALRHNRQRDHVLFQPYPMTVPPTLLLEAQQVQMPPPDRAPSDADLDAPHVAHGRGRGVGGSWRLQSPKAQLLKIIEGQPLSVE
jgi:hypothetical protein